MGEQFTLGEIAASLTEPERRAFLAFVIDVRRSITSSNLPMPIDARQEVIVTAARIDRRDYLYITFNSEGRFHYLYVAAQALRLWIQGHDEAAVEAEDVQPYARGMNYG